MKLIVIHSHLVPSAAMNEKYKMEHNNNTKITHTQSLAYTHSHTHMRTIMHIPTHTYTHTERNDNTNEEENKEKLTTVVGQQT